MIIEHITLSVMVEVLRANIDRESPFLKAVGHFIPKFQVEKNVRHQPFVHGKIRQRMPHNVASENFHTKKVCSRLS